MASKVGGLALALLKATTQADNFIPKKGVLNAKSKASNPIFKVNHFALSMHKLNRQYLGSNLP